ncbi:MAG: hypothetical protein Q4C72_10155 [Eubacteriales bacterium]|nr:hypothetical protein [Eubacteriales bacterium]
MGIFAHDVVILSQRFILRKTQSASIGARRIFSFRQKTRLRAGAPAGGPIRKKRRLAKQSAAFLLAEKVGFEPT